MKPFVPTDEQRDAITAPLRPLLLVAGAGTGKTSVMAERIQWLVQHGGVTPDQVLALTFTNKAAANLKQKVLERLGADADVTVATYHSFGASLVADHALELDLAPATQVLNGAQAWQLLFTVFDEFRFRHRRSLYPGSLLVDALQLASRVADHLVPIAAVVADCDEVIAEPAYPVMKNTAEKRRELCQVVAAYQRRKRERDLLDYGDQVALAVRLLQEHPEVADGLRDQHPVVLLDEYQDTNFAQRRLLQLVYPPGSAVTAVGDDMQSIYAFRGAHLANIRDFPRHFSDPPVTPTPLQVTFRFGPALAQLANRIQANVADALEKELRVPEDAPPTEIECFLASDDAEEAATIADEILARGEPWGDNAVLCRKRRLINPIAYALEDRKVPVEVVGASGLLDRPEVVDLVAWLEVLADPGATVALLRILEGPRYRIGRRDLAALARHARRLRESETAADATPAAAGGDPILPFVLTDALDDLDRVPDLSDAARTRLAAWAAERGAFGRAAARVPVLDLAETIVERTGLWQASGERGRENLLRFLDLAERFVPVEGDPGLPAFLEYLHLLDESEEDVAEAHPTDRDAVKVMTVHQAKGLEYAAVYVPGLAGSGRSQIFPDARPGENALSNSAALPWWVREDDDGIPLPGRVKKGEIDALIKERRLAEEWRLFYVACTRARRRLVCSAAHWYPGPAEPQGPSEFYDFVAAQTDIVRERFRHEAPERDPAVAAKERQREAAAPRYDSPVKSDPAALPLDDLPLAPAPSRSVPVGLSVTSLVSYARCPKQFYWSVVRPLPRRSSAAARLGTEVHRWIEQRAGRQLSLIEPEDELDSDDLDPDALPPGAGVVAGLKASFLASPYADLDPVRVEAPFSLVVEAHVVRGRVDAVYERDGRFELVDFKTGARPAEGDRGAAIQLDLYALAASSTWGQPAERLRTTYCWLRTDGAPELESHDWDGARLDAVRSRLATALDDLAARRFGPTPGPWCTRCDFLSSCAEGRAFTAPG